jgi:DNA polymerase-3 subunit gamma/tau
MNTMSQLVLARKYRPHSFFEMVGQDHVVQALTNALTSGRLHHAYMFTGTRGVGKTTVSRILAKSLNCLGPDGQGSVTANPCGVCQACRDIDLGRFVDYTELDAASNRTVDEVQSLLEQAVYKPVQGRFKVFMIDEVHMLTGHAFNAMLKTLEEPPAYLKFVLATTDPQKVPITVLSRCLQFNLRPIAPQTVFEHLQKVLAAEALSAQDAALGLLSKGARGSMRDALSLLDQAIAFGGVSAQNPLTEAAVRQMLSAVDSGQVVNLLEAIADGDGSALIGACDKLRAEGLSAGACLEELTGLLQRIAVIQAGGPLAADGVDADQIALDTLAQRLPGDVVHLLYSLALHGRPELGLAPDEHAALMMIMLRALVFMPTPSGEPGLRAESRLITSVAKAAKPASVAYSATPPRPTPLTPEPGAMPKSTVHLPEAPASTAVFMPWEADNTGPDAAPAVPSESVNTVHAPTPTSDPKTAATVRHLPVKDQGEPTSRTDVSMAPGSKVKGLATADFVMTEMGDFWLATVRTLMEKELIGALVRELALQSQLLGRDDLDGPVQRWQLRVERESLSQGAHKDRLVTALGAIGHSVQIALEVGSVTDSPAKRIAARQAELLGRAEQVISQDEFVQHMMQEFGAKIVPGSIQFEAKP